jgi:GNAT superfamily N-acetyltransferase
LHGVDAGPPGRPALAVLGGRISRNDRGHAWLNIIEKIPNPGPEDELHAYITNVYVEYGLRNQGVGARLLDAALDYCKASRVDSVILWPTERSRSLYERHGFTRAENVMLAVTGVNAARLAQSIT